MLLSICCTAPMHMLQRNHSVTSAESTTDSRASDKRLCRPVEITVSGHEGLCRRVIVPPKPCQCFYANLIEGSDESRKRENMSGGWGWGGGGGVMEDTNKAERCAVSTANHNSLCDRSRLPQLPHTL
jgi:hypothetical protein